jgi:predicted Fe-Mo cluster-binding NifX family protein
MRMVKVAVASSDGKRIDEAFGCATKFYIYDVEEKIALLEIRRFEGLEHDHEGRINLIRDCAILVASKIGCSVDVFFATGIYPLVSKVRVRQVLERLRPRIGFFKLR